MAELNVNKKTEELKEIISTLQEKIEREEVEPVTKSDKIMDRITYLKRKLSIFKELLLKYNSTSV